MEKDRVPSGARRAWLIPAAACALFCLTGAPFIPRLGIEADEALFAAALLPPRTEIYTLRVGHYHLPLMLLNYLGTLKSLLYRPMIRAFGTGVWATRLPILLAGAASVWLFYWFLRRVAGERAAAIGCGLLAVDSVYLLSTCFDWGPVALQHLLIMAGLLLLMKFWQERRDRDLAAGFFLFGLAAWDKALAAWILIAMGVAAVIVWPRPLQAVATKRRVGTAALALALGALPLIVYNVDTGGGTLRGTVGFDSRGLANKATVLWFTFNQSGLYGFLPYEDSETPHPHAPGSPLERISAQAAHVTGQPRTSPLGWAFGAALLLGIAARGAERRAILFAVITMALAWCQMAFNAGTGTSLQHTILLWPLPQMVIGISFADAPRRWGRWGLPVVTAVTLLLMASGLAVTNGYYATLARNGAAREWTDALFPLSDYLKQHAGGEVFAADWGIMDGLRLLNRGRLLLGLAGDPLTTEPSAEERATMPKLISRPENLFIRHMNGLEFFPGLNLKLRRVAEDLGYRAQDVAVIRDSGERPSFEVFRFVRGRPPSRASAGMVLK